MQSGCETSNQMLCQDCVFTRKLLKQVFTLFQIQSRSEIQTSSVLGRSDFWPNSRQFGIWTLSEIWTKKFRFWTFLIVWNQNVHKAQWGQNVRISDIVQISDIKRSVFRQLGPKSFGLSSNCLLPNIQFSDKFLGNFKAWTFEIRPCQNLNAQKFGFWPNSDFGISL